MGIEWSRPWACFAFSCSLAFLRVARAVRGGVWVGGGEDMSRERRDGVRGRREEGFEGCADVCCCVQTEKALEVSCVFYELV
jgi:hypothetical protein